MQDPYLDNTFATNRLKDEYKKYGRLVVATDFDDTLFDFHRKGHTYEVVLSLLKRCQALGFFVVVFTGSEPEKYPEIREYCKNIGLDIDKINENAFPMPIGNNGKIYFNVLLDDRAGLPSAFQSLLEVVEFAEMCNSQNVLT